MIPKIIHQIWLGPNKKPDIWMDSWKINYCQKYPDWEYKLWTEKEILELNLRNKIHYDNETFYNAKSDIARYEILYQYGGVFIDADSLWLQHDLDWILEQSNKQGFFAASEPVNQDIYANGVFGCEPKDKIVNAMIWYINLNYQKLKVKHPEERQVWIVTGTKPFTLIINQFKNDAYLLNHQYFYPVSFHQNNLNLEINNFKKDYPKAIMLQYGYTTNNILHQNCIKKFIEK
jgi:inositol phosphorylceramide mannosyltransferase catalytic subunit